MINIRPVARLAILVLICALIAPAISSAPVAAYPEIEVYCRIEGPADEATFSETGKYELIWAGTITVPTEFTFTAKSGTEYHLYVDTNDRYIVERTSDSHTWDRGEADQNIGATSILAALHQASMYGGFDYEVTDTWFPGMGFFISSIEGHTGSGALGWNYRVWNPDDAYVPSLACDMLLLGYDSTPLALPHEQVLLYWGSTSDCYPLKLTTGKTTVEPGEEFTATLEYYKDLGWSGMGDWTPLAEGTIELAGETFTTDDNGELKVYLETEGTYHLTAKKNCDGGTYYIPSDGRTELIVSAGNVTDWWTQTTQGDFASGTADKVDSLTSPGDVRLERGGTVSQDYILDNDTDELGGEHFYNEFKLINGATLNVPQGEILRVHANQIEIDDTSTINADGRGHNGGEGGTENGEDGFGMGGGSSGIHSVNYGGGGGGAGHNKDGGAGSYGTIVEAEGGTGGYQYGEKAVTGDDSFYPGSGGGGGAGNGVDAGGNGGKGGGAVVLECMSSSTVNINGTISADGTGGSNGDDDGCGGGGGGSGGTILIKGKNIHIDEGMLSVEAGDGGDMGGTGGGGGGGGTGGHIKVFYEICDESSGHNIGRGSGGVGEPYDGSNGQDGSGSKKQYWYEYPAGTYYPLLPYYNNGTLISATHDTGYTADFGKLRWCATVPSGTEIKFQIATNNDDATWDFKGPDGTAITYYTTSGTDIWSGHDGDRYIKYKTFLSTIHPGKTPQLGKVGITYTAGGSGEIISFTVIDHGDHGLNFGNLVPGSNNNPESSQNGSQGAVSVIVGAETSVDCNIQLKGSGDFSDGGSNIIALNNARWNNLGDPGSASDMSTSYITIGISTTGIEKSIGIWHWVNIPYGQEPATYTTDFYYQAVKQ